MRIQLHILSTLLLFSLASTSSAQTFLWNRTVLSEGFDEAYDLATDQQGNVYVVGMIEYLADFGNGVVLEARGVHDIFIAKYDSLGNLIWARRDGGRDGDKAHSIALDGQGYFYLVGEFEDSSQWGPFQLIADGGNNMFVARYDTSGGIEWVRHIGTSSGNHTRGYGVCCDANSNVYIAGGTTDDAYYNGNYLFTSDGDYDGMFISFDKFGNFRFAKRMGGNDSDKARACVSDMGQYVYLTGYYSGNADIDGDNIPGQGHTDIFLAKFDTLGTLQWATYAGDTGFDRSWDIDINVNGQIIIAGDQSRAEFDNNTASCQGRTDAFIAAYDDQGNNLWVAAGGGPEDDEGKGCTHDAAGNVYLIGDFGGSAIFPPYSFSTHRYAEPFIVSYTADGSTLRWIRTGTGPVNDRGMSVGLDNAGNIYACGHFFDSLEYAPMTIQGDSLYDIFVVKLSSTNMCATSATVSGTIECFGECNGTATTTATGMAPFSYSWNTSPVQQTQTATGLCAGTYTVTVTDNTGCTATSSITLTDPPQLMVSASADAISCNGVCDGTATVTAAGQGPFSYSWDSNPVQTTETATGLCAGSYTVTVTDDNGCTATSSVTLSEPAPNTVSTTTNDISCFGLCDGSAEATASGNGPFTYSWNTVPVQTTEIASGLCNGSYTVTVTDVNGCTTTASVTLTNPQQLIINPAVTSVSCNGDCNGSADAIVTGQSPFTFSWNTSPVQTSQAATNLCAGIYTVTVTDAEGCTASSTALVSEPLAVSLSGTVTDATCAGCTDGSINVSSSGGTGAHMYLWSNGETTEDLSNVGAGTYTVCVTDVNLCTLCDSFLVEDGSTGIEDLSTTLFSVFPNPASDVTTIRLNEQAPAKAVIQVYNSIGALLLKDEIEKQTYILNIADRSPGIYFIEITNGRKRMMAPLIKE